MMYDLSFLNVVILGNEVWRYLAFLIVMLITYPIERIVTYITKNYFTRFAQKTTWKFDDILINSLNPTISLFVLAALFYVGASFIEQGPASTIFEKIFNFFLIIPGVYFLTRFSTEIIGFYLKGKDNKSNVNEAAIDLLMAMVRIGLGIIGVLLVLANLGYDITALLTGLGVGGLAFALAAQDVLKNFFAGVAMILDGTFRKGDRIRFQDQVTFIQEVKLRTTKLRTLDGTIITAPNSLLAENMVENIAKAPKYKVNQVIGVTYDTSLKKLKEAKQIVETILKEDPDIVDYWVLFDNFGSYTLDIQVIYFMKYNYSDWPQRGLAKERINFAIKEKFEKAGIEFAFPTQTIEIKK